MQVHCFRYSFLFADEVGTPSESASTCDKPLLSGGCHVTFGKQGNVTSTMALLTTKPLVIAAASQPYSGTECRMRVQVHSPGKASNDIPVKVFICFTASFLSNSILTDIGLPCSISTAL